MGIPISRHPDDIGYDHQQKMAPRRQNHFWAWQPVEKCRLCQFWRSSGWYMENHGKIHWIPWFQPSNISNKMFPDVSCTYFVPQIKFANVTFQMWKAVKAPWEAILISSRFIAWSAMVIGKRMKRMELSLDMTTRGQTRMASDKLFEIVCSCLFMFVHQFRRKKQRQ